MRCWRKNGRSSQTPPHVLALLRTVCVHAQSGDNKWVAGPPKPKSPKAQRGEKKLEQLDEMKRDRGKIRFTFFNKLQSMRVTHFLYNPQAHMNMFYHMDFIAQWAIIGSCLLATTEALFMFLYKSRFSKSTNSICARIFKVLFFPMMRLKRLFSVSQSRIFIFFFFLNCEEIAFVPLSYHRPQFSPWVHFSYLCSKICAVCLGPHPHICETVDPRWQQYRPKNFGIYYLMIKHIQI